MHSHRTNEFDDPARYDRHASWLTRRPFQRVAAAVAALGLPPGALVVDVGSGSGSLARGVAAAAPQVRVVGVDPSEPMVAYAREHVPGASFELGGVEALPFGDGTVDLAVSTLSQHHWPDRAAGYRDLARVLRPGGSLWVYDVRWALDVPAARAAFPGRTVTLDRIGGLAGLLVRRLTVHT
jgi:ubiquinone/menaquinone biosynthesis C-methylase UbiE